MNDSDLPAALLRMASTLDAIEIPFMICGSVASSRHGEPRTTIDIDLVIDLSVEQGRILREQCEGSFSISAEQIADALARRASFNLIDFKSGLKLDFFVLKDRAFSQSEFRRRERVLFDGPVALYFATAEDTLLGKLEWFRKGGEVSDRQWRDIRGLMKAQRDSIDREYCRQWASALEVQDLWQIVNEEYPRSDRQESL